MLKPSCTRGLETILMINKEWDSRMQGPSEGRDIPTRALSMNEDYSLKSTRIPVHFSTNAILGQKP